mgnify:CR=1 FL=1
MESGLPQISVTGSAKAQDATRVLLLDDTEVRMFWTEYMTNADCQRCLAHIRNAAYSGGMEVTLDNNTPLRKVYANLFKRLWVKHFDRIVTYIHTLGFVPMSLERKDVDGHRFYVPRFLEPGEAIFAYITSKKGEPWISARPRYAVEKNSESTKLGKPSKRWFVCAPSMPFLGVDNHPHLNAPMNPIMQNLAVFRTRLMCDTEANIRNAHPSIFLETKPSPALGGPGGANLFPYSMTTDINIRQQQVEDFHQKRQRLLQQERKRQAEGFDSLESASEAEAARRYTFLPADTTPSHPPVSHPPPTITFFAEQARYAVYGCLGVPLAYADGTSGNVEQRVLAEQSFTETVASVKNMLAQVVEFMIVKMVEKDPDVRLFEAMPEDGTTREITVTILGNNRMGLREASEAYELGFVNDKLIKTILSEKYGVLREYIPSEDIMQVRLQRTRIALPEAEVDAAERRRLARDVPVGHVPTEEEKKDAVEEPPTKRQKTSDLSDDDEEEEEEEKKKKKKKKTEDESDEEEKKRKRHARK